MSKIFEPIITIGGVRVERIPLKTKIITENDLIADIVREFALPHIKPGDILTISESPLAITQGRAIPEDEIKPGKLAHFLSSKVMKVPYGVGLGLPTTMQCAIDECGTLRILVAVVIGGITKKLGRSGDFYRIAGMQSALVDSAGSTAVGKYVTTVVKGPLKPGKVAQELADEFGFPVAIVDVNDIGNSWAIGYSKGLSKHFVEAVVRDNPQGQDDEQTPLCIIRRLD